MILVITVVTGLLTRVATGRQVSGLSGLHIKGETLLLVLLVVQAVAPLIAIRGAAAGMAYWVWLATFPVLIAVVIANVRVPGMILIGIGLALNLVVIVANHGMPVDPSAVAVVRPGLMGAPISASDFVHVPLTPASELTWLADNIPLPGPSWLRSIVSPGDLLLFSGLFTAIALGGPASRSRRMAMH